MKKMLLVLSVLAVVACQEEQPKKDYVTFSGTISNQNSDSLTVRNRGFKKVIKVNEDGTFSDTLKVEDGMYYFNDGSEGSSIFLKNGYDLALTMDAKEFDESITYTGEGSDNNNFLAEKALKEEKLFGGNFDSMDAAGLDKAMSDANSELTAFIEGRKGLDSLLVVEVKKSVEGNIKGMKDYYGGVIALRETFPKGTPSPIFEGYENVKGGTTSLSDLKGKYVYIDVWATWCAPCKAEIPFLKELEIEMHDKNIAFVSMSVDDDRTHKGSWEQANIDWKAMVADKELGGVQIMAPKGWQSQFVKDYQIKGIPRFILIDPNGNVVDPSAPRPSDPTLKTMLAELL